MSKSQQQLTKTILRIISAWESLPEGRHSPAKIQQWLVQDMKPTIDKARKAIVAAQKETT